VINEVSYSERLDWPEGRPRTPASARLPGLAANPSASSPTYAIRRIQRALDRLGATAVVVSSDLALTRGAVSYLGGPEPDDPAACVRFQLGSGAFVVPCDRFVTVIANLMAIARHIEATIALVDHGVVSAHEALAGLSLRRRPQGESGWRAVFGNVQTPDELAAAFRRLAQDRHPDRPSGSHDAMAELCRARDEALRDLRLGESEPEAHLERMVFDSDRPFEAMRAAERFLTERGFCCGPPQRGAPRGVLLGSYHIRKWADLSDVERGVLDGQMTGDMRHGPVTLRIKRSALALASWPIGLNPDKTSTRPRRRRERR
jgi:hypothetical protein